MTDKEIALMIVQSLAMNLAGFPEEALQESGASLTLCAGIKAARDAFHQHVSESEIEALHRDTWDDRGCDQKGRGRECPRDHKPHRVESRPSGLPGHRLAVSSVRRHPPRPYHRFS